MFTPVKMYPGICALWLVYISLICALGLYTHNHHTVTHYYFEAGQHWFNQLPLYTSNARAFVYFPQAAILYFPLTLVTFAHSELIWRGLSITVYAIGIFRLSQLLELEFANKFFPLMSLISIPIAFSSARNGQMNLLIAGLMMLAMVATKENAFAWAAGFFTLSLALKPTALILYLLMFVLYRPLRWRMLLGLLVIIAVPFLTVNWHYVWEQYQALIVMLTVAGNDGSPLTSWAQIFGVLALLHINVSPLMQYACRIIVALSLLGICFWLKQTFSPARALFYSFALAMCYLLLFNPRSENNDYALIAPAIGYLLAYNWYVRRNLWVVLILASIAIGIMGGYTIAHSLSVVSNAWVTPLMGMLFVIVLGQQIRVDYADESVMPAKEENL